MFGGLAVLNACLAYLAGQVAPRRLANTLAVLLFGTKALAGACLAATAAGAALGNQLPYMLNAASFAPMLVLPFVFPWRRLSPRGERLAMAAAALLVAPLLLEAAALGWFRLDLPPVARDVWWAFYWATFFGVPAVGTLVLLDAYAGAQTPIQRHQARFFLAAYLLKDAVNLGAPAALAGPLAGGFAPVGPLSFAAAVAAWSLTRVAVLAVPAALAWARVRKGPPRPLGGDAFVLAVIPLGFLVRPITPGEELEYLLLRPLLLAYGMLQYQLLDLDLHANRPAVLATLLAAMGATFVMVATALQRAAVEPTMATGVALFATVAAGGALAWPLLRIVLGPASPAREPRGEELYRAALEEVVAAEHAHDSSGQRLLRALRTRLGISEREHAFLELAVRSTLGGTGDPVPGARFLGKYRVERLLGRGGFGRTYLALDEEMRRPVVLKVARAEGPEEAARMLREARLVARVAHPHIVTIYDAERVGRDVILVLEYMDGGSLADALRKGPLPAAKALAVADDVLAALEAAHAADIVHRDVKPANILLNRQGRAKLADFGAARAPAGSDTASGPSLAGSHPGSLRYMAPEQVRGEGVDARCDLYATGAVLCEALEGRPYLDFDGKADFEVRLAILEESPRLPPGVPKPLQGLLREVLAKDPRQRPASAAAMRARLATLRMATQR